MSPDPSADPAARDATGLAHFIFEMGALKRLRRAGWWHVGVRDPESVAEHSLRVAQVASLIAAEEGADPAQAAFLAIWHDSQETRTGDIPHTAKPYLPRIDNEAVTADQVARIPEHARKTVQEAVTEYEAQASHEARCARTPTSSNASSRHSNTRQPDTTTCKTGSTPRTRACAPTPLAGSPTLR